MSTKACRHCKQPIHSDARICHHCKSVQSWFGSQKDPRFALLGLGIVALLLVVMLLYVPDFLLGGLNGNREEIVLQVSDYEVDFDSTSDGTRLSVLGQVKNRSNIDATGIWIRVDLENSSGKLLDSILVRQDGLIVPAGESRPVRVMGPTITAPENVANVSVTVERERRRGRYD